MLNFSRYHSISSENMFLQWNWCQTNLMYELDSLFSSQGPGNVGILTAQILLSEVLLQANTKPLLLKGEIGKQVKYMYYRYRNL
jgi:hypothetical protein